MCEAEVRRVHEQPADSSVTWLHLMSVIRPPHTSPSPPPLLLHHLLLFHLHHLPSFNSQHHLLQSCHYTSCSHVVLNFSSYIYQMNHIRIIFPINFFVAFTPNSLYRRLVTKLHPSPRVYSFQIILWYFFIAIYEAFSSSRCFFANFHTSLLPID